MGQGKRLSQYIEKQGFTKKEFCNLHALEYNTMVMIMAEKRTMGIIVVDRIHNIFPKMNIHWLLYGEGPEEVIQDNFHTLNEPSEHYGAKMEIFKKELLEALEDIEIQNKLYEKLHIK